MKRIILVLAISFSLISTESRANDAKVNPTVLQSFNTSFKNATEVNWTVTENYFKAQFHMNGQYVAAYYDQEGRQIALSKNISPSQLPIALQVSLKLNDQENWISELFELSNEQGTFYFITLENAEVRTILKSGLDSTWSTYKKISKK